MLLMQWVKVRWDKSSRGGVDGDARRKVPTSLSFSASDLPGGDEAWIQHVSSGNNGERETSTAVKLEPQPEYELGLLHSTLRIRPAGELCSILLRESSLPLLSLRKGETAQLQIEGQNMSFSYSWYESHFINVAFLERYDAEIFRLRPFDHTYQRRADFRQVPSSSPVPARWRVKAYGEKQAWKQMPT